MCRYAFTSALSHPLFVGRVFVCACMVSHPHHHSPHTNILASLVKGRWIDGKAQALILLLSVCDTPTFFYLSNFSAVKTEGLLYTHQPLHPHNPLKATSTTLPHTTLPKPHYPLAFCNANICMCRYAFASAPSFASHQHPCLPCQREVD